MRGLFTTAEYVFFIVCLVLALGIIWHSQKGTIDGYKIKCVEGHEYYETRGLTIRRTPDGKFVKCEKGE